MKPPIGFTLNSEIERAKVLISELTQSYHDKPNTPFEDIVGMIKPPPEGIPIECVGYVWCNSKQLPLTLQGVRDGTAHYRPFGEDGIQEQSWNVLHFHDTPDYGAKIAIESDRLFKFGYWTRDPYIMLNETQPFEVLEKEDFDDFRNRGFDVVGYTQKKGWQPDRVFSARQGMLLHPKAQVLWVVEVSPSALSQ